MLRLLRRPAAKSTPRHLLRHRVVFMVAAAITAAVMGAIMEVATDAAITVISLRERPAKPRPGHRFLNCAGRLKGGPILVNAVEAPSMSVCMHHGAGLPREQQIA